MPSTILKELDASGSVLFLGSGFSHDAKNIRNTNIPVGLELKDEFARLLGIPASDYDLKTLADEVASRQDLNLYLILYELFTVRELKDYQRNILKLPWLRIYTTNYDDISEFAYHEKGVDLNDKSFSYDDDKPRKLPRGAIIHLHGIIRKANQDNVLEQLVLNENSYIRQHFEKSQWYDDFSRDLRFCSSSFFVGYNLSDYHITALLLQNPQIREKTYFVTPETHDPIFSRQVAPYGEILPISAKGFSELCDTLPSPAFTSNPHGLKAFRYIDPFMDKKSLAPPTPLEVLNLVAFGTFNYQRCLSTLPAAAYVVPRQEAINNALQSLQDARTLVIHSWLGNGKTLFLYMLAYSLSGLGYHCFFVNTTPLTINRDTELLNSFEKTAIFFDWYYGAEDVIEELDGLLPNAKFIVAVRTAVHEARLNEITSQLPSPLRRVNLNSITKTDVSDIKTLLNKTGLRVPNMNQILARCRDFREIVVTLYNNEKIRNKVKEELMPLLANEDFKKVFIDCHLLKWLGHEIDAGFLRAATQCDAYAVLAKYRETAGDVFRLDNDDIQVRSAMFAEYVIKNHLSTVDIIGRVYELIIESVKRKSERRYQAILSSLMRFWVLKDALKNDTDHLNKIRNLFDRLQRDMYVNREPLFWLQYAILMEESGKPDVAEKFVTTAYARAAASKGFKTFQIDTYALGLFLRIERNGESPSQVTRFERIIENLDLVRQMIGDGNIRYQAIQVLNEILPFIVARGTDLSSEKRTALMFHLGLVRQSLEGLTPFERQETSADIIVAGVKRASENLLAQGKT